MAQMSESMDVPNMVRRQFMNLLAFGTVTGTAAGALYPVVKFFIPPSSGGSSGGTTAKDALGNDFSVSKFLETRSAGDRTLTDTEVEPVHQKVRESLIEKFSVNLRS